MWIGNQKKHSNWYFLMSRARMTVSRVQSSRFLKIILMLSSPKNFKITTPFFHHLRWKIPSQIKDSKYSFIDTVSLDLHLLSLYLSEIAGASHENGEWRSRIFSESKTYLWLRYFLWWAQRTLSFALATSKNTSCFGFFDFQFICQRLLDWKKML